MKKIYLIIFSILFILGLTFSKDFNTRLILQNSSNSIVKVVSSNHVNYIATGIIIKKNYVLTSSSILKHRYNRIKIYDKEDKEYNVKLVGRDYIDSLALLKISSNNDFKPLKISKNIEIGDDIFMIGTFYNRFPSVFKGIISSKSNNEILIDAPLVPGMSGGAILNSKGELIGILRGGFGVDFLPEFNIVTYDFDRFNIKNRMNNSHLCYAIPIIKIEKIVETLIKRGDIQKPWLGVFLQNHMDNKVSIRVQKNSPAEKYGLKDNDIILSIDNKKINNSKDVVDIINTKFPGDTIEIKVLRNKKTKIIKIILGELKSNPFSILNKSFDFKDLPKPNIFKFNLLYKPYIGVEIKAINEKYAKAMGVKEGFGLLVLNVKKDSPAYKAGIKEADIIVYVNNKEMRKMDDIEEVIKNIEKNEKLKLIIYRNKKKKEISLSPEFSKNKYEFEFNKLYNNLSKIKDKINMSIIENYKQRIKDLKNQLNEFKNNKALLKSQKYKILKSNLLNSYKKYLNLLNKYKEKCKKELKELELKYKNLIKEMNKIRKD